MNNRQLYRDILNEGLSPDFEQAILHRTLATARRVRRTRLALRGGLAALITALALLSFSPKKDAILVSAPSQIPAQPAPHRTLTTQPFPNVLRTGSDAPVPLLVATASNVPTITTSEAGVGTVRYIDDDQLLALLQGVTVALVRHGPDHAELVFPAVRE